MTGLGTPRLMQPGDGQAFNLGPDRITLKGSTEDLLPATIGGFSVIEYTGAAVEGPPPHVHRGIEEAWYILDGAVDFLIGSEKVRGGPGAFALIPRGVPHGFKVVGPESARWIGIFSPASGVHLLEQLSKVIPADGPPDLQRILEVFAAFETEVVAAPPA